MVWGGGSCSQAEGFPHCLGAGSFVVLEQASSKAVGKYVALGRVTYLCFLGSDPGST